MIFEPIAAGGCLSYILGCSDSRRAVLIDPVLEQVDHVLGLVARHGLRIEYLVETHTHADHFSASPHLSKALQVPVIMHPMSAAPYANLRLNDRAILHVGTLRLQVLHTPGHTLDSLCLLIEDMVFSGDTLLIGGTGRTDLPTGSAAALFDSLFDVLLKLPNETKVFPGHDYRGRLHSTIGEEIANNPRLQKRERAEFIAMMDQLNLPAPVHLTEALRVNMSGAKTVSQMVDEASTLIAFISVEDLRVRLALDDPGCAILDVREKTAYQEGHIPGARHLPRGELELRVNTDLPDPSRPLVLVCETGMISILAAATLRALGFSHALALEGGMKAWRDYSAVIP